jgi:hypothetical protein
MLLTGRFQPIANLPGRAGTDPKQPYSGQAKNAAGNLETGLVSSEFWAFQAHPFPY